MSQFLVVYKQATEPLIAWLHVTRVPPGVHTNDVEGAVRRWERWPKFERRIHPGAAVTVMKIDGYKLALNRGELGRPEEITWPELLIDGGVR